MKKKPLLISFVLLLFSSLIQAEVRKAPEWDISEWINGSGTNISNLKGKVIVVEFFQLWCPGCKGFSLPLMEHWEDKFAKEITEKKLVMVSIHTVFEGHSFQTNDRLRKFLKERGIDRLVGVDKHRDGQHIPETMKKYRTRGTPEMAIIDKWGNIRFQHFGGFHPERVEEFIYELINET